jgi:hypothetical protein
MLPSEVESPSGTTKLSTGEHAKSMDLKGCLFSISDNFYLLALDLNL